MTTLPAPAQFVWRQWWTDVFAGVVLTSLAIVGFQRSFGGSAAIVVGIAGTVLGAAVAAALVRSRMFLLAGILVAAAVFVLFGAVAVHHEAIGRVLPSPKMVSALFDGLVNGWRRLLTASPPLTDSAHALVVPYFCGFAGAGCSVAAALRWPSSPICVVSPVAVLVAATLLGTRKSGLLIFEGGLLVIGVICWLSCRESSRRQLIAQRTRSGQRLGAVAMLAAAGVGALLVGAELPSSMSSRFVLRDHVAPPFDPSTLASPLVGYRRYTVLSAAPQVVFTAHGLPLGTTVRLAVLDDYDGTVWRSSAPGTPGAGRYEPEQERSTSSVVRTVSFVVGTLRGVFVPTVSGAESIQVFDAQGHSASSELRSNSATTSALDLTGLAQGDQIRITVKPVSLPASKTMQALPVDASLFTPLPLALPTEAVAQIQTIVAGATSPYGQMLRLQNWALRLGYYSDGGSGIAPGHSLGRILPMFTSRDREIGDGEQYAAAVAVAARQLGLPARVVMGFKPTSSGNVDVHARDVTAWVEVAFDRVGWVPFAVTPASSRTQHKHPVEVPKQSSQRPPPPSAAQQAEQAASSKARKPAAPKPHPIRTAGTTTDWSAVVFTTVPLLAIAILLSVIVAMKARRRHRRRSLGPPVTRITNAWLEVVDQARDLGYAVPGRSTRFEVARSLAVKELVPLAAAIDQAHFADFDPSPETAASVWDSALDAAKGMRMGVGRRRRLRAVFGLSTFRRGR